MLNPAHLRTLVAVARTGSFAAAANVLGYSASAISQQMAALEKECGVALFDRTARAIEITAAGRELAARSIGVLDVLSGLPAATRNAADRAHPSMRIGVFPTAVETTVSSLSWCAEGSEPFVYVGEPSEVIARLGMGRELDLGVVYQVVGTKVSWPLSFEMTPLLEETFAVVVPARWNLRAQARPHLEQRPWIIHRLGSGDETVMDAVLANAGVRPRIAARSDDYTSTLAMIAAGLGASLLPRLMLRDTPPAVEVLDGFPVPYGRKVFALHDPQERHPDLDRALSHLVDAFARGLDRPATTLGD